MESNSSSTEIISSLQRENARLKDEIGIFKKHIKESRELTDKDLIASLRHDINVRNKELVKAGQTIKAREDRIAYLEDHLEHGHL